MLLTTSCFDGVNFVRQDKNTPLEREKKANASNFKPILQKKLMFDVPSVYRNSLTTMVHGRIRSGEEKEKRRRMRAREKEREKKREKRF